MEVLRSLVPMPTGLTNKSLIFSHFGYFTNVWVCSGNFGFLGWGSTPQTGSDVMAPFADWLISWKGGVPRAGPEKAPEGQKRLKPDQNVQCVPGDTREATAKVSKRYLQLNRFYEHLTFITAKSSILNF